MFDVTCALAILLTMLRLVENPGAERTVIAAVVGGISVFFSHPAISSWPAADWPRHFNCAPAKNSPILRRLEWLATVWLVCFAADYCLFLYPFSHGEAHPHLVQYWRNSTIHAYLADLDTWWIFNHLCKFAASPARCGWCIRMPRSLRS